MYLIRKRLNSKAHHWLGTDTACRMYQAGGMRKDRYKVFEESMGRPICHMCEQNHGGKTNEAKH